MSTQREDNVTTGLMVILAVGVGLAASVDAGWTGLGLWVVVLALIFGFGG